jgi:hypothetical protein
LSQDRGNIGLQLEIPVQYEVTAHASKIDRAKKVGDIDIEDVSSVFVLARIGNDRPPSPEAMRNAVWMDVVVTSAVRLVDLLNAVL